MYTAWLVTNQRLTWRHAAAAAAAAATAAIVDTVASSASAAAAARAALGSAARSRASSCAADTGALMLPGRCANSCCCSGIAMAADGESELRLTGGASAEVPFRLSCSASLLQATSGEVARLPAELHL